MKKSNHEVVCNTAIYVRLSKEDGEDKEVSNSIQNQKDLIKNYIKSFSDVRYYDTYSDDGFSGFNFQRPAFEAMMNDIKKGLINCIVVKDLSRFGRNWTETGKYIDNILPSNNVRFIAINDHVDTINKLTSSERIIIPFKNLMNEAYIRDISDKTKSHLKSKCENGQFIGAFAPYGYKKHILNRNKLVVDEEAAKIVDSIFSMKLEGYSSKLIAETLNRQGVLSPMEYRKLNGENFYTPFKNKTYTLWSVSTINRILKNEVYLGVLLQGKTGKINFKINKRIEKDKMDWIRVENAHKPIISEHTFMLANDLMDKDLRKSPTQKGLFPFSGLLVCAECHGNMIRKTVSSKGKKYFYYVCSQHKNDKSTCSSSHIISEEKLENAVIQSIRKHSACILEIRDILQHMDKIPMGQLDIQRLNEHLHLNEKEIDKYNRRLIRLKEDLRDKLINQSEYNQYQSNFNAKITSFIKDNDLLKLEIEDIAKGRVSRKNWIELFTSKKNIDGIDRLTAIQLIESIIVHEKSKIEIRFKYQDDFLKICDYINEMAKGEVSNG